ncbi:MAG TPA: EF-Tu/IF-2/RF-3 family GTPase [Jatrophihabitans sp.]|nr:EF-Tu/IF-2/RF-3 family GTPase [Jatrophihabitans sp.]
MALFRRKNRDSLDPQYLLEQAQAATPPAAWTGGGFHFTVEDVFTITGRGTVVTGRIASGSVTKGDTVRQTRPDGSARDVTITGIEMFRRTTDTANAGDNVGLLLRNLGRDDIGRGDVLSS